MGLFGRILFWCLIGAGLKTGGGLGVFFLATGIATTCGEGGDGVLSPGSGEKLFSILIGSTSFRIISGVFTAGTSFL